jgi:hypothetical protein
MYKPRYLFSKVSDLVRFYDSGVFQFSFSGPFNRPLFESYASENSLSSNWVGSMLRLFYQCFPTLNPTVSPTVKRNDADRFLTKYGDQAGIEILRSRGFQVNFRFESSISELIEALEVRGFEVKHYVDQENYGLEVPALKNVGSLVTPNETAQSCTNTGLKNGHFW